MSIHQDGINISPKLLLALGTIVFAAGGGWLVLKDAPKDINALSIEHRAFEKTAHNIHHDLEIKDNKHDIQLAEIRANQKHMRTGIDDIKGILLRHGRNWRVKPINEDPG